MKYIADIFWPPDRSAKKQLKSKRAVTRSQKKHQLRVANLRRGKCNINNKFRTYLYHIILYMYAVRLHAQGARAAR